MRLTHTVAFRLFLVIASVQVVILGLLTFAAVRIQQAHVMDNVVMSASRVSDVIARSMRHSMLLNRKEDVHQIIASIGGEPGIDAIQIYNKEGEIIFGTSPADLHAKVDMSAEACIMCHVSGNLAPPSSPRGPLSRLYVAPNGNRVLGFITPIRNEAQCANAACHAHPADKTILGVLDVKMSLAQIDARLAESRNRLFLLSGIAVVVIAMTSGVFIWFVVRRPVRKLVAGMDLVAAGHLSHRLAMDSHDEIGQLAGTFNRMTTELHRTKIELTKWSSTLEDKVREKTADLEKAHRKMIAVEKMASLGGLASTVAHELNNPLEGILTFARLIGKRIGKLDLPTDVKKPIIDELHLVADEAQRSGNIVKNLLEFSRQHGGEFRAVMMQPILDRCIMLMRHHAEIKNIRMVSLCTIDEEVECDAHQVQQMLIALMVNAIESMAGREREGGNELTLSIVPVAETDSVELRVADTGTGIDEETRQHMFEPFFTTKSEVKGVGLGLAVVYGIVQRHHGSVEVESTPGVGTVFIVRLPLHQTHVAVST
jgi:two-component system NtrC family sensor kinase